MEFIPMYVDEPQNKEPGDIIKNTDWNNLFNLLMTQGNHNTDALLEITQTYPTTAQMNAAIAERIVEIGAGDMAKAVYDTDEDGIVDLAETVVDGGITTDKIADNAINENKLSDFLLQYIQAAYTTAIDKSRVKLGKITELTPTRTNGQTGGDVTVNYYNTYNIGFTPAAVIIFDIRRVTINSGSSYDRDIYYWHIAVDETKYYEYSSYVVETFNNFGGIAFQGSPCIGKGTSSGTTSTSGIEVFRIVSNGFKTHIYQAEHEYNNGDKRKWDISEGQYYLAIG